MWHGAHPKFGSDIQKLIGGNTLTERQQGDIISILKKIKKGG
jgi:hypothetical protein